MESTYAVESLLPRAMKCRLLILALPFHLKCVKKICEGMLTVEVSEVNFTEFHPTNVLHKVWSALALGISFF